MAYDLKDLKDEDGMLDRGKVVDIMDGILESAKIWPFNQPYPLWRRRLVGLVDLVFDQAFMDGMEF